MSRKRLDDFRAPDFDAFRESMSMASRFTLMTMAHDYLLVLEQLSPSERERVVKALDADQFDDEDEA